MRARLVSALCVVGLVAIGGNVSKGVDESRITAQQWQAGQEDRDRGPGREIPPDGRDRVEGDVQPRVAPEFFPPRRDRDRFPQEWWLGIYATNTPTGVVVTRVVPGSPASRVGLEPNDRIVSVNGYQVGYVMQRFYPLGEELQRRAGPRGDVTLLVQNWRNNRLINIDVRLREEGRNRPVRPFGQEESGEVETQARTLPYSDGQAELPPPPEPPRSDEASDL